MSWFKKDKYQSVKNLKQQVNECLNFTWIQYRQITEYELCFLEDHPEIPRRAHQSPEFRMHMAKVFQVYAEIIEERLKEDEETPAEVKERKKIEKKIQ